MSGTNPRFFATPAAFRAWLKKHHATEKVLWVGFHRKASGRPSITWPESVDEALCVGWIDGLRKGIDEISYMIRFTPRKRTSAWSIVNLGRVAELTRQGRMQPAGAAAFENRVEAKSGIYSYEQRRNAALDEASARRFRQTSPGMEVLSGTVAILSENRGLVGDQRQARSDPTETARDLDR